MRRRVALACDLLVAFGYAAMGAVYLASPRFMPYHARVAGMTWAEVPPRLRLLLLAFQRGAGAATLACGLAVAILALVPLRRGEPWARWAIAAIGLTGGLPLLAVTVWLARASGVLTPWPVVAASVVVLLVGVALGPGRSTSAAP